MKRGDFRDFNGVITYNHIEVNEGGGLNGESGKFNAPVAGIYAFSFSSLTAVKSKSGDGNSWPYTTVGVFKDGRKQFTIDDANRGGRSNNIGSSWMFKLRKGEEVYLNVYEGKLRNSAFAYTQFSGHLLMADE